MEDNEIESRLNQDQLKIKKIEYLEESRIEWYC